MIELNKMMCYVMKIKNLTPHTVNVCDKSGNVLVAFESDGIARCSVETVNDGFVMDNETGICIDLTISDFGEVVGLPEWEDGVMLIVSRVVAEAVKGVRSDCVIPNESVRDSEGRIIGCLSFGVL